ncbi:MAG TPA: hypothetical protein VHG52_09685, partial [Thermomicrobiales bacterium]|nr:hypothetical protein [Thermomicrobiales bacterium]
MVDHAVRREQLGAAGFLRPVDVAGGRIEGDGAGREVPVVAVAVVAGGETDLDAVFECDLILARCRIVETDGACAVPT